MYVHHVRRVVAEAELVRTVRLCQPKDVEHVLDVRDLRNGRIRAEGEGEGIEVVGVHENLRGRRWNLHQSLTRRRTRVCLFVQVDQYFPALGVIIERRFGRFGVHSAPFCLG